MCSVYSILSLSPQIPFHHARCVVQRRNIHAVHGNWKDWFLGTGVFSAEVRRLRQSLRGKVQLFIPDPPYCILKSHRDKLTAHDMDVLVTAANELLSPEGTVIIFCSATQYADWDKRFKTANFYVQSVPLTLITRMRGGGRWGKKLQNTCQWAFMAHASSQFIAHLETPESRDAIRHSASTSSRYVPGV